MTGVFSLLLGCGGGGLHEFSRFLDRGFLPVEHGDHLDDVAGASTGSCVDRGEGESHVLLAVR